MTMRWSHFCARICCQDCPRVCLYEGINPFCWWIIVSRCSRRIDTSRRSPLYLPPPPCASMVKLAICFANRAPAANASIRHFLCGIDLIFLLEKLQRIESKICMTWKLCLTSYFFSAEVTFFYAISRWRDDTFVATVTLYKIVLHDIFMCMYMWG